MTPPSRQDDEDVRARAVCVVVQVVLSDVHVGGCFTVNLVCLPAKSC